MRTAKNNTFQTIRSEGGLLPSDLLQRLSGRDKDIPGVTESSYHLSGEKLNEAINRSWNRLSGAWKAFQDALTDVPDADPATSVTREKWLLPLFEEFKFGRLQTSKAHTIDSKTYPISHGWGHLPIHLIGAHVDLDQRSQGVAGASRSSPHSMVQEFLNRSDDHLWAVVSNGLKLRILRDNITLTRQAFLEFDLAAMFEGESYSDFAVLWMVCHQSRVEAENPNLCWLEKWSQFAEESGTRALEKLREGVEQAIESLGRGFLAHPANTELRQKLASGELDKQDYYRQLLRLIYRFIFLFVAEDREQLLVPDAHKSSRQHYADYYSLSRLRNLAERRIATQHTDLWKSLTLLFDLLGEKGCPALGLPALGSFLWSGKATAALDGAAIANRDLLRAIYRLSFVQDASVRRSVDYRNLGAEELGSIYEALLEMHPQIDLGAKTFALATAAGNERKTTGSYYTPTSLVNCLLDSALDPVIAQAAKSENREQALLDLKICDPACGSGHFLIAAAHRLAKRLATVRTGDEEPSPEETSKALRDVIGRCIFGVDINPMAVELCKVSLWMEAMEPGKPLSFLDHHIQCGNSLLGATPALISRGIPDAAFKPITGDDKAIAATHKKDNKDARKEGEKKGQELLDFAEKKAPWEQLGNIPKALCELEERDDSDLDAVRAKEAKYRELVRSSNYENAYLLADAWCAAFVYPKDAEHQFAPLHTGELLKIERNPHSVNPNLRAEIKQLAERYQFLHWHLAFPQIFQPKEVVDNDDVLGWEGGFDCMLGNPPWEKVKLQEKEWFAERDAVVANSANAAARKKQIKSLITENPALWASFQADLRKAEGESHIIRDSERYPLCGRGDVNTYTIFAESNRQSIGQHGRAGFIVPSGMATDDTTKVFFQNLLENNSLESFFEFENEGFFSGAGAGHMVRFAMVTILGAKLNTGLTKFLFHGKDISDLNIGSNIFTLSSGDIKLLNPNTKTCPVFHSGSDAVLTKSIYRRVHTLWPEDLNGNKSHWEVSFLRMFDMANDSKSFITKSELIHTESSRAHSKNCDNLVPLLESKLIYQYNHRFSDFRDADEGKRAHKLPANSAEKLANPNYEPEPYYWLPENSINSRLNGIWDKEWLLGWRRVTDGRASARTFISCIMPRFGASDSIFLILPKAEPKSAASLNAIFNSFILDYVTRQKLGGINLSYFVVRQLPILSAETLLRSQWINRFSALGFIIPRILSLVCTSQEMEGLAKDCGYDGPPFRWDEARRFLIRCELDATFFHLYLPADDNGDWKPARVDEGAVIDETKEQIAELRQHFPTPRDAVAYIMETFPIVKRKDEKAHGHYRTKDTILEIYDAMLEAQRTGQAYQTRLDPPPGPPTDAEGNFIPFEQWKDNIPSHIHQPQAAVEAEIETSWRDKAFEIVASKRVAIEPQRYLSTIVEALLTEAGSEMDFEEFRRAYWLLTEPKELERLGKEQLSEIPADWWATRQDELSKQDFLASLNGAIMISQIRLYRENGIRMIQWTGEDQENPHPQVIDDARAALLLSELWQDEEAAAEWQAMDVNLEALFA